MSGSLAAGADDLKPADLRLQNLIKEVWHTRLECTTDNNGFADIEGFKGTYEIAAEKGKGSFVLAAGMPSVSVVIK